MFYIYINLYYVSKENQIISMKNSLKKNIQIISEDKIKQNIPHSDAFNHNLYAKVINYMLLYLIMCWIIFLEVIKQIMVCKKLVLIYNVIQLITKTIKTFN